MSTKQALVNAFRHKDKDKDYYDRPIYAPTRQAVPQHVQDTNKNTADAKRLRKMQKRLKENR